MIQHPPGFLLCVWFHESFWHFAHALLWAESCRRASSFSVGVVLRMSVGRGIFLGVGCCRERALNRLSWIESPQLDHSMMIQFRYIRGSFVGGTLSPLQRQHTQMNLVSFYL